MLIELVIKLDRCQQRQILILENNEQNYAGKRKYDPVSVKWSEAKTRAVYIFSFFFF